MEKKIGLFFVISLLVVMAVIIPVTLSYPRTETKLVPLLAASIVFVLAAVQLVRDIRANGKAAKPKEESVNAIETKNEFGRRFGVIMCWMSGFFLILYFLGFLVAIPIFVFSYLKLHGYRWLTSITSAIILTVLIHSVFNIALKAQLFKGLILE
jgi:hypothetical protein